MIIKMKAAVSLPVRCLAAALLFLAAAVVVCLGLQPAEQTKTQTAAALSVGDNYQRAIENEFTKILFGEVSVEKEYRISDTAQAAPVPDPACYGEAESAAELQWLLDKAEQILDGQELYFTTDTEILPGSTIHYYLDDTILAITWKQVYERAAFTFSEVKLLHASQFRRYLSGGEFGSGKLSKTTEMSQSVNAVVACSADYYSYRRKGVTITNGIVHKSVRGVADLCFIDNNGDMILERGLAFADAEEAQAYADENSINFSLSFGPILVKDGEYACPKNYDLGEVKKGFPRAAICQMAPLHYLFAASNMEAPYYNNMTMMDFAQCIYETGCLQAYALDGGQTATVVMDNQLINHVNYGSERLISDIIYFATAKPAGE